MTSAAGTNFVKVKGPTPVFVMRRQLPDMEPVPSVVVSPGYGLVTVPPGACALQPSVELSLPAFVVMDAVPG